MQKHKYCFANKASERTLTLQLRIRVGEKELVFSPLGNSNSSKLNVYHTKTAELTHPSSTLDEQKRKQTSQIATFYLMISVIISICLCFV